MSFVRNYSNKYKKQLLETDLDALKTASKKAVHEAAEVAGEFIRNKFAEAVAKSNDDKIVKQKAVIDKNSRNVEKRVIKQIKCKSLVLSSYSKLLNELTISKSLTKNGLK